MQVQFLNLESSTNSISETQPHSETKQVKYILIEKEEDVGQFSEFVSNLMKNLNARNDKAKDNNSTVNETEIYPQNLILGVDCEGLSRTQPLSLIQIGNSEQCYLFDILKLNGLPKSLKQVLEDPQIIKVFHDFCEDTSALVQQYAVHCDKVFDTQIAHRLLNRYSDEPRDQNISLNQLLIEYIDAKNDQKDAVCALMKTDSAFWWKRPLTQSMCQYAAQDVVFLPRVYQAMMKNFIKENQNKSASSRNQQSANYTSKSKHRMTQKLWSFDATHQNYENLSMSTNYDSDKSIENPEKQREQEWEIFCNEIYEKTQLCERYAYINTNIPQRFVLKKGDQIKAFVKNFQQFGIYCSLNLGYSGYIQDDESIRYIKNKYQIGDIIELQIAEEFSSEKDGKFDKALIMLQIPQDPQQKQRELQRALFSCLAAVANQTEDLDNLLQIAQAPYRLTSYSDYSYQQNQNDSMNKGFFFGMSNQDRTQQSGGSYPQHSKQYESNYQPQAHFTIDEPNFYRNFHYKQKNSVNKKEYSQKTSYCTNNSSFAVGGNDRSRKQSYTFESQNDLKSSNCKFREFVNKKY
ncbi:3-5 exonuclease domain containing protein [Stylonychia lemnae]|uniref:3-5 exonuclease domain containing protein n=1 Tax=Stylonychia lemnae TaxID=5949 RepID=A0A078BCL3_STYLE|nr:3-5 exonuclease domain containing protein [Stylonychia lemnae]|eukprot:CDW90947.1 3-5 exonuclease domain containing protein [Stylonychia lemnae]